MKFLKYLMAAWLFTMLSCTLDRTDYEAEINTEVTENSDFKEAATLTSGDYKISVGALNGTFNKGYNDLHVKVFNTKTQQAAEPSNVRVVAVFTNAEGAQYSAPHPTNAELMNGKYFKTYTVFPEQSTQGGQWELHISFTLGGQTYKLQQGVDVQAQNNKNLNIVSFTGNDNQQYIIALVAPQKPQVAENDLIAGIYKYQASEGAEAPFTYAEVKGYTLQLDPRMPEPSMGNHSSLNNKDLVQKNDGFYHGVVNYTMTGNWTLNFIMLNQNSKIIKGTVVPKDFTPGVEGKKSELYIDILF